MAKKKLASATVGMGSIRGSSKEVNPSFSLRKAPVAKPAAKADVQVNPTFSAGNSQTKSGAKMVAARTQTNKTYSVAKKGSETSKGTSGPKLVARKGKVGASLFPLKGGLSTGKLIRKSNSGGSEAKGLQAPRRNAEGPKQTQGQDRSAAPATPKGTQGNFKGTATQGNARKKPAAITVSRLRKLGY